MSENILDVRVLIVFVLFSGSTRNNTRWTRTIHGQDFGPKLPIEKDLFAQKCDWPHPYFRLQPDRPITCAQFLASFLERERARVTACFCLFNFSLPPLSLNSLGLLTKLQRVQSIQYVDLMDNYLMQGVEKEQTLQQIFGITRVKNTRAHACMHASM